MEDKHVVHKRKGLVTGKDMISLFFHMYKYPNKSLGCNNVGDWLCFKQTERVMTMEVRSVLDLAGGRNTCPSTWLDHPLSQEEAGEGTWDQKLGYLCGQKEKQTSVRTLSFPWYYLRGRQQILNTSIPEQLKNIGNHSRSHCSIGWVKWINAFREYFLQQVCRLDNWCRCSSSCYGILCVFTVNNLKQKESIQFIDEINNFWTAFLFHPTNLFVLCGNQN